jgi:hypothetical protein
LTQNENYAKKRQAFHVSFVFIIFEPNDITLYDYYCG